MNIAYRAAYSLFFFALAGTATASGCSSESANGAPSDEAISETDSGAEKQLDCSKNDDCPSKVCDLHTKTCKAPACDDGVKNADETDLDCGGATCAKCDVQKTCADSTDCASGVCAEGSGGKRCQAPTCSDGIKDGDETDVDCGGGTCGKCSETKGCTVRDDCSTDVCKSGVCVVPVCNDGETNGSETDVDCGGPDCPRCASTKACTTADDCASGVCTDNVCKAPTCTDSMKNGNETDTDCGGPDCPRCAPGLSCATGSDCTSSACNYKKKCVVGKSCTQHYGGDTCGLGGEGGQGAAEWQDCCVRQPVTPSSGPTSGSQIMLDKYQVTAGRMREFLESINYDVRAFVKQARAQGKIPLIPDQTGDNKNKRLLEADWDMYLPVSFDGSTANEEISDTDQDGASEKGIYSAIFNHLGGRIFKNNQQPKTGCYVGAGTHTFRFPDNRQDGSEPDQDQTVYDTKSMQCVDYLVAQAFCIWDGGRLQLGAEWLAAWGNGTNASPWLPQGETRKPRRIGDDTYFGCRFPATSDANYPDYCTSTIDVASGHTIEFANYQYSYEWPTLGDNYDYIVFISAPGRLRGRGPNGHADIIGNNYGMTSDVVIGSKNSNNSTVETTTYDTTPFTVTHGWNAGGSWEVHNYSKAALSRRTMLLNKYGKLGFRCAYP